MPGKKGMPVEQRFMQYVQKQENGCWLWTGGKDKDGYGEFGWPKAGIRKAHKASYRLFKGGLPIGKHCLHSCDTPSCVFPDHLFAGTARENIDDMLAKGRSLKGQKNSNHKLTVEQVQDIRSRGFIRESGCPKGCKGPLPNSTRSLAREFNVTRRVITLLLRGVSYQD